jgi:hypothetical protein
MMKLVLGVILAGLLLVAAGCGVSTCPLDKNGDGALTDADFTGMSQEDIQALYNQYSADPLALTPCLPMIQAAAGSIPELGT